jgi:hypothetical protein
MYNTDIYLFDKYTYQRLKPQRMWTIMAERHSVIIIYEPHVLTLNSTPYYTYIQISCTLLYLSKELCCLCNKHTSTTNILTLIHRAIVFESIPSITCQCGQQFLPWKSQKEKRKKKKGGKRNVLAGFHTPTTADSSTACKICAPPPQSLQSKKRKKEIRKGECGGNKCKHKTLTRES